MTQKLNKMRKHIEELVEICDRKDKIALDGLERLNQALDQNSKLKEEIDKTVRRYNEIANTNQRLYSSLTSAQNEADELKTSLHQKQQTIQSLNRTLDHWHQEALKLQEEIRSKKVVDKYMLTESGRQHLVTTILDRWEQENKPGSYTRLIETLQDMGFIQDPLQLQDAYESIEDLKAEIRNLNETIAEERGAARAACDNCHELADLSSQLANAQTKILQQEQELAQIHNTRVDIESLRWEIPHEAHIGLQGALDQAIRDFYAANHIIINQK